MLLINNFSSEILLHYLKCFYHQKWRFTVKIYVAEIEKGSTLNNSESFEITIKVPIAATKTMFVYKIQVNPIHTILKYGIYYDFMDR